MGEQRIIQGVGDGKRDRPPTKQNYTRRHTPAHIYTKRDLSTSASTESEPQKKPELSYPTYQYAYCGGLARGPSIFVLGRSRREICDRIER